jgi:hypothetical protein
VIEQELLLLDYFVRCAPAHGLNCDRYPLTHVFVTLKTNQSILIVGPAKSGKIALVRAFGQAVAAEQMNQMQFMVGHARWASGTRNSATFVEIQSRLNDNRILSLIADASQTEDRRRLFAACLTQITPFEIYRYLSVPGFQLWPWMTHITGSRAAEKALPFPVNFRLISTMDTEQFQWWDCDLLAHTAVVHWNAGVVATTRQSNQSVGVQSTSAFPELGVRDTSAAYRKLKRLLRGIKEPFGILLQVTDMFGTHGLQVPLLAVNQATRYLANAWSDEGEGLFATSVTTNLQIGLDLAIRQYVLPWAMVSERQSFELQQNLALLLDGQFHRQQNWPDTSRPARHPAGNGS